MKNSLRKVIILLILIILVNPLVIYRSSTSPGYKVTFYTNPHVGSITFSGTTYTNGQSGDYPQGDYEARANPPKDYAFHHWEYSGSKDSGVYISNIGINPTTVRVQGDGWIKAVFSAKITFYTNPSDVGSITYGSRTGKTYTNGQVTWEVNLPPDYDNKIYIAANPSSGYKFKSWTTTGSLSVEDPYSQETLLIVNGPGTLTANFEKIENLDFVIDLLTSDKTSYDTGETVKLWARIKNTGNIQIDTAETKFTVIAPSGNIAYQNTISESIYLNPGSVKVLEDQWIIPSDAETGSYTIKVEITAWEGPGKTGVSKTKQATANDAFSVNAPPAPDFSLSITPTSRTIKPGETAIFEVEVIGSNGWTNEVTLSVSGLPSSGVSAIFSKNPVPPGEKSILTIKTTSDVKTGQYFIVVKGTYGTKVHTVSATLIIQETEPSFDFKVTVEPSTIKIIRGDLIEKACKVTVTLISGSPSRVDLSYSGLPSSVGVITFSSLYGMPTFSSTVDIAILEDAKPGEYNVYIIASGGGKTRKASLKIIVEDKIETSIYLDVDPSSIKFGESVVFSGAITPLISVEVEIVLTRPDGNTLKIKTQSNADGKFEIAFTPDIPGLWKAKAFFKGDRMHKGCSSEWISFVVEGPLVLVDYSLATRQVIIGDIIEMNLIVKNTGDSLAVNVSCSIDLPKEALQVVRGDLTFKISTLPPSKSECYKLILRASRGGDYEIRTNITYSDTEGNKYEIQKIIWIGVKVPVIEIEFLFNGKSGKNFQIRSGEESFFEIRVTSDVMLPLDIQVRTSSKILVLDSSEGNIIDSHTVTVNLDSLFKAFKVKVIGMGESPQENIIVVVLRDNLRIAMSWSTIKILPKGASKQEEAGILLTVHASIKEFEIETEEGIIKGPPLLEVIAVTKDYNGRRLSGVALNGNLITPSGTIMKLSFEEKDFNGNMRLGEYYAYVPLSYLVEEGNYRIVVKGQKSGFLEGIGYCQILIQFKYILEEEARLTDNLLPWSQGGIVEISLTGISKEANGSTRINLTIKNLRETWFDVKILVPTSSGWSQRVTRCLFPRETAEVSFSINFTRRSKIIKIVVTPNIAIRSVAYIYGILSTYQPEIFPPYSNELLSLIFSSIIPELENWYNDWIKTKRILTDADDAIIELFKILAPHIVKMATKYTIKKLADGGLEIAGKVITGATLGRIINFVSYLNFAIVDISNQGYEEIIVRIKRIERSELSSSLEDSTILKCSLSPPIKGYSRKIIKNRYLKDGNEIDNDIQFQLYSKENHYGEIIILVKEKGLIEYNFNGIFPTVGIFPEYIFKVQDRLKILVNGSEFNGIFLASIALNITFKSREYAEMMYNLINLSPEVINLYTTYIGFPDVIVNSLTIKDHTLIVECLGESYLRENVVSLEIVLEVTKEKIFVKKNYEGYLVNNKNEENVLNMDLTNEVFNLTVRHMDMILVKIILHPKSYITWIEPNPTSIDRQEDKLTYLWSYVPTKVKLTFIIDLNAPEIIELSQNPASVSFLDTVTVSARVADNESGISTVYLLYTNDHGKTWNKITMNAANSDTYEARIPPHPLGTKIIYYIEAVDNVGNIATSPQFEYTVIVPPWIILLALITLFSALILLYRSWKKEK